MNPVTVLRVADAVSAGLREGKGYFKAFDEAVRGLHLNDAEKSELRRLVGSELGKRRKSLRKKQ